MEDNLEILKKGLESAQKFLENICLPASEEFGLMIKDKVRIWRLNNIIKILNHSSGKIDFVNNELTLKAHPRVVSKIMEKGSWQDNYEIQKLWAGLLSSSLESNGLDDENIIFIDLLNKLTIDQVRIIEYFSKHSIKEIDAAGKTTTKSGILMDREEFFEIVKNTDIDRLSAEINHLSSIGLIESGFGLACGFFEETEYNKESNKSVKTGRYRVGIKLSPLALRLYVKGQGFNGSLKEYFEK